jgi:hypothetical protein
VNADDPFAGYWKELNLDRRVITFGLARTPTCAGTWTASSCSW